MMMYIYPLHLTQILYLFLLYHYLNFKLLVTAYYFHTPLIPIEVPLTLAIPKLLNIYNHVEHSGH